MFQDKYKKDNEWVKPEEQTLSSLMQKMQEVQKGKSEPAIYAGRKMKRTMAVLSCIAACLAIFLLTAPILLPFELAKQESSTEEFSLQDQNSDSNTLNSETDIAALPETEKQSRALQSSPANSPVSEDTSLLKEDNVIPDAAHIKRIEIEKENNKVSLTAKEQINNLLIEFPSFSQLNTEDVIKGQKSSDYILHFYYEDNRSITFKLYSAGYLKECAASSKNTTDIWYNTNEESMKDFCVSLDNQFK